MFLFLGLILAVSSQVPYDYLRNYTEAFMTGYMDPDYVFPYSSCLTESAQTSITDKIIGAFIFLSSNDMAQVRIVLSGLKSSLEAAAAQCDLNKFYSEVTANKDTSTFNWILRLWWNSVLLYRNCKEFPTDFFTNKYEAFHSLGECAKFIYPNS